MRDIQELVHEQLDNEDDGEDLADFISEGDGDALDEIEEPVKCDETFPCSVFIANLPTVGKEKYDKLLSVISKLIDKAGKSEKYMPLNPETGKTGGFVIATYEDKEAASNAVQILDGMSLDKAHTFKVVKLDTFDEIANRAEEFEAKSTIQSFSRHDFREWLCDKNCREQFLLRYQDETEIHWHDMMAGLPQPDYCGEREKKQKKIWCDSKVQWSPQGSFIVTFHKPGIALWAGPNYEKKVRMAHESVKQLEFSPDEEFVLTWNGSHSSEADKKAVRIFRVLTGEQVWSCRTPTVAPGGTDFPHFLWSNDGKYFAECSETTIFVRDTVNFDLIKDDEGKKRTLKYDGLNTFQWSPKDNIIAAWVPEKGNSPARLVLVEVPSRRELASRSRTSCEATMHWQSEGDYLCLLVTKLSKTKKKEKTSIEIFRLREKNVPVEVVEVKDQVTGFYWETKGRRFGVLTTDEEGHHPKVLFYSLLQDKCELVCTFPLPSNSFSNLVWAPEGQYFVIAAMGAGDLLFGSLTPDNRLELTHKDEHFMLTDVSWDPSSRYVITSVTQPMGNDAGGFKYQMEAGYALWTFQGRVLHKKQMEKLWHVAWRPHPLSLLKADQQREIRKNIKLYSKRYDALDDQAKETARSAFRKERDEKKDHFQSILDRLQDYKEEREEENGWRDAQDDYLGGQEWTQTDSHTEEELNATEEVIG